MSRRQDEGTFQLRLALDNTLKNELNDIETVIDRLLGKVLVKLGGDKGSGDKAFKIAARRLDHVKYRILGLVGPLIPDVLMKILGDPTVIPVIRQIFADNWARVIETDKGWLVGKVTNIIMSDDWWKDKVLSKFDPKIEGAVKSMKKVIYKRCDEWEAKAKAISWVPDLEHQLVLRKFGLVKSSKKPDKKTNTKVKVTKPKKSDSKKSDSSAHDTKPELADNSVALLQEQFDAKCKEQEQAIENLQEQLTICYAVIAALAVCFFFSLLYICLFKGKGKPAPKRGKPAKKPAKKRDTNTSEDFVDLEAGLSERKSKSPKIRIDSPDDSDHVSRRSRDRHDDRSKRSHRHSRRKDRHSRRKDRDRSHRHERWPKESSRSSRSHRSHREDRLDPEESRRSHRSSRSRDSQRESRSRLEDSSRSHPNRSHRSRSPRARRSSTL